MAKLHPESREGYRGEEGFSIFTEILVGVFQDHPDHKRRIQEIEDPTSLLHFHPLLTEVPGPSHLRHFKYTNLDTDSIMTTILI